MYLKKVASKSMERWKAGKFRMCLEGFHMWGNEGGGGACGPSGESHDNPDNIFCLCFILIFCLALVLLWLVGPQLVA